MPSIVMMIVCLASVVLLASTRWLATAMFKMAVETIANHVDIRLTTMPDAMLHTFSKGAKAMLLPFFPAHNINGLLASGMGPEMDAFEQEALGAGFTRWASSNPSKSARPPVRDYEAATCSSASELCRPVGAPFALPFPSHPSCAAPHAPPPPATACGVPPVRTGCTWPPSVDPSGPVSAGGGGVAVSARRWHASIAVPPSRGGLALVHEWGACMPACLRAAFVCWCGARVLCVGRCLLCAVPAPLKSSACLRAARCWEHYQARCKSLQQGISGTIRPCPHWEPLGVIPCNMKVLLFREAICLDVAMVAVMQQHVPEPYRDYFSTEEAIAQGPQRALEQCKARYDAAKSESSMRKAMMNTVRRLLPNPFAKFTDKAPALDFSTVVEKSTHHAKMLLRAPRLPLDALLQQVGFPPEDVRQRFQAAASRSMPGLLKTPATTFTSTKNGAARSFCDMPDAVCDMPDASAAGHGFQLTFGWPIKDPRRRRCCLHGCDMCLVPLTQCAVVESQSWSPSRHQRMDDACTGTCAARSMLAHATSACLVSFS